MYYFLSCLRRWRFRILILIHKVEAVNILVIISVVNQVDEIVNSIYKSMDVWLLFAIFNYIVEATFISYIYNSKVSTQCPIWPSWLRQHTPLFQVDLNWCTSQCQLYLLPATQMACLLNQPKPEFFTNTTCSAGSVLMVRSKSSWSICFNLMSMSAACSNGSNIFHLLQKV